MLVIVNCPKCMCRFQAESVLPPQVGDKPASVIITCPECQNKFQFQISGFPDTREEEIAGGKTS